MSVLEDSGIDSEDKQSTTLEDAQLTPYAGDICAEHLEDLEVSFRGKDINAHSILSTEQQRTTISKLHTNDSGVVRTQPPNTCRILQRKLELKVERVKRNYNQYHEENSKRSQSENLIPINRLPIPGDIEQRPLVDYKSESSDENDEEISFFPAKLNHTRKQKRAELSDTFSIQEMTIESDIESDDSGSQNLELLPPKGRASICEKFRKCFGCINRS